jgi:hypothetical protein
MDVTGSDLAPCRRDTDLGFGEIRFFEAHRIEHRTAGCAIGAIKYQTGKGAFLVVHRARIIDQTEAVGKRSLRILRSLRGSSEKSILMAWNTKVSLNKEIALQIHRIF